MIVIAFLLTAVSQAAITPLPTTAVSLPQDVALVESVSDTMSALSRKVTACVDAGGKVETCRCSDPQDLAALRKRYAALIKQRPEWKDRLLSYQYLDKEGRNISGTLMMSNLRRQLETLKCQ